MYGETPLTAQHPVKIAAGDSIRHFALPDLSGTEFDTRTYRGRRHLISLLRFATCPFCNLRVHRLVQFASGIDPNFGIIAVFDASHAELARHAARHEAPFPILADEQSEVHALYAAEQSVGGVVKGMVMRAPTLMAAMAKGFVPRSLGRAFATMPVDLLVDEDGVVRLAHYGRDEGDHICLERIRAFASGERLDPNDG